MKVLMVTGVYTPEINGAVLQCDTLIKALADRIGFEVLTGTQDKNLVGREAINGIQVTRVYQRRLSLLSKLVSTSVFISTFVRRCCRVDIVHIHGFSLRNALIIFLARCMLRPVILKMSSYGQDDPLSVRNKSRFLWIFYEMASAYIAIGPAFLRACEVGGLKSENYYFIPNGVNTEKFAPLSVTEKEQLRSFHGLGDAGMIVLFVGHFSTEKRPDTLYHAWASLIESGVRSTIIFIGKTRTGYEVDQNLSAAIEADAKSRGIWSKVRMIEQTSDISNFMKMADIFVHPSTREGMPNVVLESMASGLPCIVTDLPGVTDWLIHHGETGFLFPRHDVEALRRKLAILIGSECERIRLGANARQWVLENHGIKRVSLRTLAVYEKLSH